MNIILLKLSILLAFISGKAFAFANPISGKKVESAYFTCIFKGNTAKQIPSLVSEISKKLNIDFDESKIELNSTLGSGFSYLATSNPNQFEFILNMVLKDSPAIKEKDFKMFTFGSNSSIDAGILKPGLMTYSFRSMFNNDTITVFTDGDRYNLRLGIGSSTFPKVRFSKAERVFNMYGRFVDWNLTDVSFDVSYHKQGLRYLDYDSRNVLTLGIDNFVNCLHAELDLL